MTAGPETEHDRDKRRAQRALFDTIAGQYEASRPGYPAPVLDFVAATAGISAGCTALEIGCGTGQLTEGLARRGLRLTAIDIGPALIDRARRRPGCTDVSFQLTAFEDLAAADASFDLIISAAAFHWIDPQVAFGRSARLLRSDGWLALLGTADEYDDPVGPALDELWVRHGDTGGAWQRRPPDPDVIAATGLFGPPGCLTHRWRDAMSPAEVVGLERTRATFLSWPPERQSAFAEELRSLAAALPVVGLTRQTTVTMAPVLCGRQ